MSKKLLSILLSAVMLFSTMAILSAAVDTDYKDLIDREFLTGRSVNDTSEVPETADKAEILAENLKYWKQEIQDEYAAASTNADYEALYNKMKTPVEYKGETYTDFWYANRDESYGKIDYTLSADVKSAEAGDEITVTGTLTTNFLSSVAAFGVVYDKTLVELDSISASSVFQRWNAQTADVPTTTTNLWPVSLRNQQSYDQYGIARVFATCTQTSRPDRIPVAMQFDNKEVFTATFIVKESVKDGDVINFFVPNDCDWTSDRFDEYLDNTSSFFNFSRVVANEYPYRVVDSMICFDHTYKITNTAVTVGSLNTSALENAIKTFDETDSADYTVASWANYAATVDAGKAVLAAAEDQTAIDNATANIENAAKALTQNNVISANQVGKATVGEEATISVAVEGSPKQIRFVNDGATVTFNAEDATIVKSNSSETWTVKLFVNNETESYKVFANYGTGYHETYKTLDITTTAEEDLAVYSVKVSDMYNDYHTALVDNNGTVKKGRHNIEVKTSTDAWKFQFVDASGNTWTYSTNMSNVQYVDKDGIRTWTVSYNFCKLDDLHLDIRTRSYKTSFIDSGADLDAFVLY